MKYSENYKFALPTAEDDDLADIGAISLNFETVDEVMKQNSNAVGRLNAKDTDLQSQIDALGGIDLSEFESDVEALKNNVSNLQSQINAKATREVAIVGSDNENSAGWYKVADGTMPALNDVSMLFAVHSTVTNKQYAGILQLNLRSATSNITCPQFGWLVRNGFEDGQVIVTTDGLNWAMYFKVTTPRYYRTFFEVLQKSDRINSALKNYNLYTNSTVETTAPTATVTSADLGIVNAANKLATARKINGVEFDGSKDIDITANNIASVSSNINLAMDISLLGGDVDKINAHLGEQTSSKTIHELIDDKVAKVEGKGLSTNDYDDTAKEKVSKIGDVSAIPTDSRYIINWIQDVYDSVFTSSADYTCVADRVTAEVSSRELADENLQSQITPTALTSGEDLNNLTTPGRYYTPQAMVLENNFGLGVFYLDVIKTSNNNLMQIGYTTDGELNIYMRKLVSSSWSDWVKVATQSDLDDLQSQLDVKVEQVNGLTGKSITLTANNIASVFSNANLAADVSKLGGAVDEINAHLGERISGKTIHQLIADLTTRVEALENSASGGTITRTLLIDWDVNTNGSTQGTVSKDADGLHASGSASMRIANYWSNNVSAYDGITFTAYGSGKLRVEVGGVEGSYVVLSTTPTTFTFDFAENGLTDLSSVEINLQTQGAYDLTVSDIYGYTKS